MTTFEKAYSKLNPDQKLAVDTIDGPVMVVAGPGTGKTQVLTLRIANILKQTDTNPENILALTFTENAARNMQRRLVEFIGTTAYQVRISTFHSFCNEIIQTHADKFAVKRERKQITDLDKFRIIQKILDNFDPKKTYREFENLLSEIQYKKTLLRPFNDTYYYQKEIVDRIDDLKKENISSDEFAKLIKAQIGEVESQKKINKKTPKAVAMGRASKPTAKWMKEVERVQKNIELLQIYTEISRIYEEESLYDFTDMVLFVLKAFEEDENLLAYYQEKFLYILVDEYQDTNGAQNNLVKKLGSFDDSPNVFVVGDDDQSIYRFQGANLANILEFKNTFPNSEIITITQNYRSTQLILDAADSIISKNNDRLTNRIEGLNKKIVSVNEQLLTSSEKRRKEDKDQRSEDKDQRSEDKDQRSEVKDQRSEDKDQRSEDKDQRSEDKDQDPRPTIDDSQISLGEFSRVEVEYNSIASKIEELIKNGSDPNEIAVIYRKHKDGEELLDYLLDRNIPVSVVGRSNILEETVIQQFLTLCEVVIDPIDNSKLANILLFDFLDINRLDRFILIRKAKDFKNRTLFDLLNDIEILNEIKLSDPMKINSFAQKILDFQADNQNLSFPQTFEKILNKSGLLNWIKTKNKLDDLNSIKTLFDFIKSRTDITPNYKLQDMLDDIKTLIDANLTLDKEPFKSQEKGVSLMTAHASKGLEFSYVFIPNLINGNWGNNRSRTLIKLPEIYEELDPELDKNEEERRLFFVALTRAKTNLFLSFSDRSFDGDKFKENLPAQFIEEIDQSLIKKQDVSKYENQIKEVLSTELKTFNFNVNEKDYLKKLVDNFKLSVTALNNYLKDPQEFLYNNLLRIPQTKTKALAMGTAIHTTLEQFYRIVKESSKGRGRSLGKVIIENSEYNQLNNLLSVYEHSLKREFLGEKEFEETLEEGKRILDEWYELSKDHLIVPAELEYSFFGRSSILEDIPLTAKIDKIEWVDKKASLVKVIDYKTGTAKGRGQIAKPVDGGEESNYYRQLVFYKLISDITPSFPYKVIESELEFVKPNKGKITKVSFQIPDSDIKALKEIIREVMEKIRNLEF